LSLPYVPWGIARTKWSYNNIAIIAFQISKINHEYLNKVVIHQCVLALEWIDIVVALRVIIFYIFGLQCLTQLSTIFQLYRGGWYSECKSSYIIYFIDFSFLCNNYVFHCRTLDVIFYCNKVGTVTLLWNKYFYYIDRGEIQRFLSEIKINKSHLFHSHVLSQDFSSPCNYFFVHTSYLMKKSARNIVNYFGK
jgi:hypothetical protein